ncbi:helix-turn-helix domain-containing protein [Acidicapsa dinghuensis]|uniref:Helix-turn-helix domain-containing protein n=1 Tax=Acidicapsa dinghuensis TaxID=2218256 RepID=A0ABW1EEU3_9BACT|nr:helix-turn-helix transcriptional regulator [Acidicapsa dinghuensis]
MTKQERDERDAAFEQLIEEMRQEHLQRRKAPDSALYRELRERRKRLGWTQAELARRVGTTQTGIARLERGQIMPRLRTLHKLAEVMGVKLVVRLEVD